MMNSAETHNRLKHLLGQELEAAERLEVLLGQEQEALVERQLEQLDQVVGQKQDLVVTLEGLGRERLELLQAAGHTADQAGFAALLEGQAEEAGLLAQWSTLQQKLQVCRDQNLVNGRLLAASRQQAQQILSILTGGQPHAAELYDRQGVVNVRGTAARAVTKA